MTTQMNNRYMDLKNPNNSVKLDMIFRRYLEIHGTVDGFEAYVNSGFIGVDGNPEYKLILTETQYYIENLFPDYKEMKPASTSKHVTKILYGSHGESIEMALFVSEENEYHFNISVVDENDDIQNMISVDSTRLK